MHVKRRNRLLPDSCQQDWCLCYYFVALGEARMSATTVPVSKFRAPRRIPDQEARIKKNQLFSSSRECNSNQNNLLKPGQIKKEPSDETITESHGYLNPYIVSHGNENPSIENHGNGNLNPSIESPEKAERYYTATLELEGILVVACSSIRTLMKVTTLINHHMDGTVIKIETCDKEAMDLTPESTAQQTDIKRKYMYTTKELIHLATSSLCQKQPAGWPDIQNEIPDIIEKDPKFFNPDDYGVLNQPLIYNRNERPRNKDPGIFRPATISDHLGDRQHYSSKTENNSSARSTSTIPVELVHNQNQPTSRMIMKNLIGHSNYQNVKQNSDDQKLNEALTVTNGYQRNTQRKNSGSNNSGVEDERWPHDHFVEDNSPKKISPIIYKSDEKMINHPDFYGGEFMYRRSKPVERLFCKDKSQDSSMNNIRSYNKCYDLDCLDASMNSVGSARDDFTCPVNNFVTDDIAEFGLINDPLRSLDVSRYM
ncbi:uncharacterized protein LOC126814217 [Patella vulgata]|uniref:uncharacterized protein LOC126814217 n=1 Tax=Patella vulgata TaxID=6465 RepID=UPI00217F4E30|nr:uncharacterized protein LOC126814217 [Patella vulgata]